MRILLQVPGLFLWLLCGFSAFTMPLQQAPRSVDAATLLEALHDLSENQQAANEEDLTALLNLAENPID